MGFKIADTDEIWVLVPIIIVIVFLYFFLFKVGYIKKEDVSIQIFGEKKEISEKGDMDNDNFQDENLKASDIGENYKIEKKEINIMDIKEGEKYTTKSGLMFEVIKLGSGEKPTIDNKVEVHYHGTLMDGKVFDSSVERGQRIEFPLKGVIVGWQEGLQYMPTGSKFKFTIPPELAYGDRSAGSIPPNSTLIFEVELFEVK